MWPIRLRLYKPEKSSAAVDSCAEWSPLTGVGRPLLHGTAAARNEILRNISQISLNLQIDTVVVYHWLLLHKVLGGSCIDRTVAAVWTFPPHVCLSVLLQSRQTVVSVVCSPSLSVRVGQAKLSYQLGTSELLSVCLSVCLSHSGSPGRRRHGRLGGLLLLSPQLQDWEICHRRKQENRNIVQTLPAGRAGIHNRVSSRCMNKATV